MPPKLDTVSFALVQRDELHVMEAAQLRFVDPFAGHEFVGHLRLGHQVERHHPRPSLAAVRTRLAVLCLRRPTVFFLHRNIP